MHNISGIFSNPLDANKTFQELLAKGFNKNNISIMREAGDKNINRSFFKEGVTMMQASVAGTCIGITLGAMISAFMLIGTANIMSVGNHLAHHAFSIMLGAVIGGAVGLVVGALAIKMFAIAPETRYKDALRSGKSIMAVHAEDEDEERKVRRILLSNFATLNAA